VTRKMYKIISLHLIYKLGEIKLLLRFRENILYYQHLTIIIVVMMMIMLILILKKRKGNIEYIIS